MLDFPTVDKLEQVKGLDDNDQSEKRDLNSHQIVYIFLTTVEFLPDLLDDGDNVKLVVLHIVELFLQIRNQFFSQSQIFLLNEFLLDVVFYGNLYVFF